MVFIFCVFSSAGIALGALGIAMACVLFIDFLVSASARYKIILKLQNFF